MTKQSKCDLAMQFCLETLNGMSDINVRFEAKERHMDLVVAAHFGVERSCSDWAKRWGTSRSFAIKTVANFVKTTGSQLGVSEESVGCQNAAIPAQNPNIGSQQGVRLGVNRVSGVVKSPANSPENAGLVVTASNGGTFKEGVPFLDTTAVVRENNTPEIPEKSYTEPKKKVSTRVAHVRETPDEVFSLVKLPAHLDTPEVRKVWREWIECRMTNPKAPKPAGPWSKFFQSNIGRKVHEVAFIDLSPADAISCMNYSLNGPYVGLFPKHSQQNQIRGNRNAEPNLNVTGPTKQQLDISRAKLYKHLTGLDAPPQPTPESTTVSQHYNPADFVYPERVI